MFIYDKDMERVMQAKKKEILLEMETAKSRVLKELYSVKESVHTDMCGLMADYNRITRSLNETTAKLKSDVETVCAEMRSMVADSTKENTETTTRVLNDIIEFQTETERALTDMQVTVETLIEEAEKLLADGVTQDDLITYKEGEEIVLADSLDLLGCERVDGGAHFTAVCCKLPFDINGKANATLTIEGGFNGFEGVYTLERRVGNLDIYEKESIVYDSENEISNDFERYVPFVGVEMYGSTLDGTTKITPSDTPYFVFFHPGHNCWCIVYLMVSFTTITIKLNNHVTKSLEADVMGTNGKAGAVLVHNGQYAEWRKPNDIYFEGENVHTLFEGVVSYVSGTAEQGLVTYETNLEEFEGFENGVTYYVTLGHSTIKRTCSRPNFIFTVDNSSNIQRNVIKYLNGILYFAIAPPLVWGENGVNIEEGLHVVIKRYKDGAPANTLKLNSPDGSTFKITVDNEGVLSATRI